MFKNMLVSLVVAVVTFTSVSAFAAVSEHVNDAASVLTVVESVDNGALLLQVTDSSLTKAKSVASQSQPQSAQESEPVLPTKWLFLVALFWFVMLSNRRGV